MAMLTELNNKIDPFELPPSSDKDDYSLTIGSQGCDLTLKGGLVSRRQMVVTHSKGTFELTSHGRNPDYINDVKIDRGKTVPLEDGDVIKLTEGYAFAFSEYEYDEKFHITGLNYSLGNRIIAMSNSTTVQIDLTPKEQDFLVLLASKRGTTVSKLDIIEAVWNTAKSESGDPQISYNDEKLKEMNLEDEYTQRLYKLVSNIKGKFPEGSSEILSKFIITSSQKGYQMPIDEAVNIIA